ncbi:hypothetical protein [Peptoniphilus asaccharolyticus]
MTEINKVFFNKKLLSFDETTGQFAWVSPKILTTTVYNEDGERLDDLLKTTPAKLESLVREILKGAPEAYDTFLEVSKELEDNKNSITEIMQNINNKIHKPTSDGKEGQVLKIVNGQIAWADDKDTIYTPSEITEAATISTDSNHRFVTDRQMRDWDSKLDEERVKEILKDHQPDLKNLLGKTDGIATLDWLGKVPRWQLPRELVERDDLRGYLTSYEADRTYAKKEDVKDVDLSNYVRKDDTSDFVKSYEIRNFATKTEIKTNEWDSKATKEDIEKAIKDLINGAPETLDTLKEIVDEMNKDKRGVQAILEKITVLEQKETIVEVTEDELNWIYQKPNVLYIVKE